MKPTNPAECSSGINILYVGTLPPHPGGSAILCYQLLKGLVELGHSIRAISPITKNGLKSEEAFPLLEGTIPVHRYNVEYFETTPDYPVSDRYRKLEGMHIRRILQNMFQVDRPDVLIIGRESFAWHVPDTAITYSIPTLMLIQGGTIHGMRRRSLPEHVTETFLRQFRKVTHIVSVAKHLKTVQQEFQIKDFSIVPNAINGEIFFPRPKDEKLMTALRIGQHDIIAAHISNLKPVKRPFDVIHAAKISLQREPRLIYLIVGDGPLRNDMEKECRRLKIQDRFRFVGWVDYRQIPSYYSLADIVLMPSEAEGLALVYLETQAMARLLLASDIPASREVIIDGETGLLFPKGDTCALAERTLEASYDPDLRRRIGSQARRNIESYSLKDMVRGYEDILLDVTSGIRNR